MKMYLMTFDEACKAYSKAYPMTANFTDQRLFGIGKKSIPWGKNVEVDINTLSNGNTLTYQLNGFSVPSCVFKVDDESLDKELSANDVLRYGTILADEKDLMELLDPNNFVRITIVAYNHKVYYVKRVNDEIEIPKELKA